ncbi:MAG: DNA-binding response regulator [Alteromonadaceae bacterium]|nr:DNA-binding response regulator [Alteromonadaceae bacterium]
MNKKSNYLYGLVMALLAFVLHLLEQNYGIKRFTTESYIIILATLFAGIGVWLGIQLAKPHKHNNGKVNQQAIAQLQLTERELEVLTHLANGLSNQEIAEAMYLSVSTVKTHLHKTFQKLSVTSRTQAISKAKSLKVIH